MSVKRFESFKHVMWGRFRNPVGKFGLVLFKIGRKLLKWSLYRCSWCGRNCGLESSISRKGLRCSTLFCTKSCVERPDV